MGNGNNTKNSSVLPLLVLERCSPSWFGSVDKALAHELKGAGSMMV